MSAQKKMLYVEIASLIGARARCMSPGANESQRDWVDRYAERLEWIARNVLPSGSGIDSGTKIDLDRSTEEKIVLTCGYHHMNEGGYYAGWTEHTITVRPSLVCGITIKVSGRDRNSIKDYLHTQFLYVLGLPFDPAPMLREVTA